MQLEIHWQVADRITVKMLQTETTWALEAFKNKRAPTYPLGIIDDHFALYVPALYLPRNERRELYNEFGDLVDFIFADYGELYIRIWKTFVKFMNDRMEDNMQITMRSGDPHGREMITNICYSQFDVVEDNSAENYIDLNIKLRKNNIIERK